MAQRRFKDPVLQKAILIYLIAFLAVYLIFAYGVLGSYAKADELRQGVARRMGELEQARTAELQAQTLAAEISSLQTRIDELRRALPPSLNEAELLRAISQAAIQAGIDAPLDSFQIKSEPRTENNLTIREYEVAYLTGYHEFARFVTYLVRRLPQVQLSELTLTGLSGPTPGRTLRGSVVLTVYSSPLAEGEPTVTGATSAATATAPAAPFYSDQGKRDPFLPPGPLPGERPTAELANLNNLYYRGMMTVDGVPAALVEDVAGFGYTVKVGDRIGGGKIVEISPAELVISAPGYGRKVLRVTQY